MLPYQAPFHPSSHNPSLPHIINPLKPGSPILVGRFNISALWQFVEDSQLSSWTENTFIQNAFKDVLLFSDCREDHILKRNSHLYIERLVWSSSFNFDPTSFVPENKRYFCNLSKASPLDSFVASTNEICNAHWTLINNSLFNLFLSLCSSILHKSKKHANWLFLYMFLSFSALHVYIVIIGTSALGGPLAMKGII